MRVSALLRIVEVLFNNNKQNGAYEKYMAPDMDDETNRQVNTKLNAPSRTITDSSFTPLPMVKALYSVRKNITLSKASTPAHPIAATSSLSYW
jgi:hypothetical protein